MSLSPNGSELGEIDADVWVPVPSTATLTSAAFECTVTFPDFAPVEDGSNAMRSLQFWPAVSGLFAPQSSALPVRRVKCVGTSTLETVTGSDPEFVIVEVCEALPPSSMSFEPNESDAGAGDSSVCVPVPVSDTVRSGTFDATVTVADLAPVV